MELLRFVEGVPNRKVVAALQGEMCHTVSIVEV